MRSSALRWFKCGPACCAGSNAVQRAALAQERANLCPLCDQEVFLCSPDLAVPIKRNPWIQMMDQVVILVQKEWRQQWTWTHQRRLVTVLRRCDVMGFVREIIKTVGQDPNPHTCRTQPTQHEQRRPHIQQATDKRHKRTQCQHSLPTLCL